MKKIFVLIMLFLLIITPLCLDTWTIMIYLAADNNLEQYAIDDFLQVSTVGSTVGMNIVVQFDRIPGYDSRYGDWTDTKRFYVEKDMTPDSENAVMHLGELNMSDPDILIDFFKWSIDNYPAQHYALIMWNHGTGWYKTKSMSGYAEDFKAVCQDVTNGSWMYYTNGDVEYAFSEMSEYLGKKIDIAGFDVCFNQMIENAFYLYEYADLLVGSQDVEPAGGWRYDLFLQSLSNDISQTPQTLAENIVNTYDQTPEWRTLSAIDMSGYAQILRDMNKFSVLSAYYYKNGYQTKLDEARSSTVYFMWSGGNNLCFIDHIDKLMVHSLPEDLFDITNSLKDNLNQSIFSNISVNYPPNFSPAKGLAIYYPLTTNYNDYYENNKISKETFWNEFIERKAVYQDIRIENYFQKNDQGIDGTIENGETFTYTVIFKNNSNFKIEDIYIGVKKYSAFCSLGTDSFHISDIYSKDTFSILISAELNPDYVGFGTEKFYFDITTDYLGYQKELFSYVKVGDPVILIVDDDGGAETELLITEALEKNEINYNVYSVKDQGNTIPQTLNDYQIVIWHTGDKYKDIFKRGEIPLIKEYLDNNGKILITGKNILNNVSVNDPDDRVFLHDYLKIQRYSQIGFAENKILKGVWADPVTESLELNLSDNKSLNVYLTEPKDGAIFLFRDEFNNKVGIRYPRYSDSGFKMIFCPFSIVSAESDELEEFFYNALSWFVGNAIEKVFDTEKILAYPNPAKDNIRFTEIDTFTTIKVYDISGKLLKTLLPERHDWNLLNETGKKLANGVYLYTVENHSGIIYTGKFAVLK